jgi:hypothetical protein
MGNDHEARRDVCRMQVKLGHRRPLAVDPQPADQNSGKGYQLQFKAVLCDTRSQRANIQKLVRVGMRVARLLSA